MDGAFDVTWQTRNGRRIVNCTCYFRGAWEVYSYVISDQMLSWSRAKENENQTYGSRYGWIFTEARLMAKADSKRRVFSVQSGIRTGKICGHLIAKFNRGSLNFVSRSSTSHSNSKWRISTEKRGPKIIFDLRRVSISGKLIRVFIEKQATNETKQLWNRYGK